MSQSESAGNGSYKERIHGAYAEAKRRAKVAYGHGVTSSHESCANEGNLMLVLFLQYVSPW